MANLKYEELVKKYTKVLDDYVLSMQSKAKAYIENVPNSFEKSLLFERSNNAYSFELKTLKDVETLNVRVTKKLQEDTSYIYTVTGVTTTYGQNSNIYVNIKVPKQEWTKWLESSYYQKKVIMYMIKKELQLEYMSDIDCSILKLYKDNIITLEQLQQASRNC